MSDRNLNAVQFAVALVLVFLIGCGGDDGMPASSSQATADYLVYFGTYTRAESKGIYVSRFDTSTGEITSPELAAEASNPNFLAVHPNQSLLYAVGQRQGEDEQPVGEVVAFAIDKPSGKLTLLNKESSGGAGPCHLNVDHSGRAVVVANYGAGSVAALPIGEDGRLSQSSAVIQHEGSSVNPERQQGPHAHSVNFSPDNRFVVAADLGLDKLLIYRFDPQRGSLEANEPPFAKVAPGAGPRHFAFHPGGRFAYAINELASTVTAFSYDAEHGAFEEQQTISTLPEGFDEYNHTAEVLVHPSGRFLYGSNRGHHSIAVFEIDAEKGALTAIEHVPTQGEWPRNFRIDPTGAYLFAANQNTHNVVIFRIDQATGRLTPTGKTLSIDSPVCIRFVPLS